jgi:ABC-2 type transport system permease protein
MPIWLQHLMQITSPTPHFVAFSQAVLYRGADLTIVWPLLATLLSLSYVSAASSLDPERLAK